MSEFTGIPMVSARIAHDEYRMFFDTGAQVSYLQEDSLGDWLAGESVTDFYPGVGRFETDTHHATEAVTDVAKGEAAHLSRAGRGKGMAWGRVVHRLLELLIRSPSLDVGAMAGRLVQEEDMPRSSVGDVVACVEQVRGSALWKRIEGAEAVLTEVPFSITREGEDLPRTTTGTVDVAFREGDGWVADYKTDAVDGNLEALVEHYRSQVEMYRACWEEITGEAVKEALLYFISVDETASG